MTWARIDDQFADHPKIKEVGPLAGWLYICGLCYANRYMTDGFVPAAAVPTLADWSDIGETNGGVQTPPQMSGFFVSCWNLVDRLVYTGLWEKVDRGYQIHDFLEYNRSKAQILKEREESALRVKEFRAKKHTCNDDVTDDVTLLQQECNATVTSTPYPVPYPSPVPHKNNTSTNVLDAKASDKPVKKESKEPKPLREDQLIWDALVQAGLPAPVTKSERGRWNSAIKELRDAGVTAEKIPKLCSAYRARYKDGVELTPTALAGNLSKLTAPSSEDIARQKAEEEQAVQARSNELKRGILDDYLSGKLKVGNAVT